MRTDNWEVIVKDLVGGWNVEIYLVKRELGKVYLAKIVKGLVHLTEIKTSEQELNPEPTLRLNRDLWLVMQHTLIDKKVREKDEVEAELKATSYHLEDLRRLLKIK